MSKDATRARTRAGKTQDYDAERRRRLELEALNGALAKKRCPGCATVGAWKIYNVDRPGGRIRYVRCVCCGHADQVPVIIKEQTHEAG